MENFISKRIKIARHLRGLSMEELSEKMDRIVTRQSISKYEKGLMKPSPEVLEAMCRALDLPVDYFYEKSVNICNVSFRIDKKIPVHSTQKFRTSKFRKNGMKPENEGADSSLLEGLWKTSADFDQRISAFYFFLLMFPAQSQRLFRTSLQGILG